MSRITPSILGMLRLALIATALAAALAGAAASARAEVISVFAQGHAYRHGVVPTRWHRLSPSPVTTAPADLSYGGGVSGAGVTTGAPRVYLVFWGSQWGAQSTNPQGNATFAGDPSHVAPYAESFMKGIGTAGETWSGVMTQYCQGISAGDQSCPSSAPHVGYPSGGAFAGVWADESAAAPAQATGNQIGSEAVKAASHFGNTTQTSNRNTQYVIVSPSGTHPDGFNTTSGEFCAWHDYSGDSTLSGGAVSSSVGLVAFTNLPYLPDAGASCGENFVNAGSGGTLDGVSIVEGHEYAETITDQYPAGGWVDGSGNENADKCAWLRSGTGASQDITLATGSFAVQSTWANDANSGSGGCEVTHPIVSGTQPNTVTVTNPGSQSTMSGSPVSLQVHATDSGSAALSYSATGLPAGLAINSTSGLISGTPTTAASWAVTVRARDTTGASGSTSFTWMVSAHGWNVCAPKQLLGNPGFETGSGYPWSVTAGVIQPADGGEPAHSGNYVAWLDGYGATTTDRISQKVTLPQGCTNYGFSFWLHIDTAETGATVSDKLRIEVLTSTGTLLKTLVTYSNLNAAAGYTQHSFSLAAYAGQTVILRFLGTENASLQTSFVVDDTALSVG